MGAHPADVRLTCSMNRDGARILALCQVHRFDARDGSVGKKLQHVIGIERRTVGQIDRPARSPGRRWCAGAGLGLDKLAAHRAGREPVMLRKNRVKAPHAAKAAVLSHLRHGHLGVAEPLLSLEQAVGL